MENSPGHIPPLSQTSFVHEIYFNHDLASQLLHVLESVAANIEKDVCIFLLKLSPCLRYYVLPCCLSFLSIILASNCVYYLHCSAQWITFNSQVIEGIIHFAVDTNKGIIGDVFRAVASVATGGHWDPSPLQSRASGSGEKRTSHFLTYLCGVSVISS